MGANGTVQAKAPPYLHMQAGRATGGGKGCAEPKRPGTALRHNHCDVILATELQLAVEGLLNPQRQNSSVTWIRKHNQQKTQ